MTTGKSNKVRSEIQDVSKKETINNDAGGGSKSV